MVKGQFRSAHAHLFRTNWREMWHLDARSTPNAMTMDGFQVDIIFNSLKELQEGELRICTCHCHAVTINGICSSEKGRNEHILAEECKKRKELEAQLEEVNSEHKIAAHKNSKMKETMKVAEMKVAQIQAQVKMYEICMALISVLLASFSLSLFLNPQDGAGE